MYARKKEWSNDEIDDLIDDNYPPVKVCGLEFSTSRILRELDPIAYSMAMDGWEVWECGECEAEYDSEAEAEECCGGDHE
jgi:hypothetical protein